MGSFGAVEGRLSYPIPQSAGEREAYKKQEARDKRETRARKSIEELHLQIGNRVRLKKTNESYGADIVEGIIDRFGMHTSNVGVPHIRSIIVKDGNGNVHSIRLRGILYIHKR